MLNLKKRNALLLLTFIFMIGSISLGRAAFSGITVGKQWTLRQISTGNHISFKVTSVSPTSVMADTWANGISGGNINIAGSYVIDDATLASFVGIYGTTTGNYGGQSLTVCDTGTMVIDTVTGILLEIISVVEFYSWHLYGTGGGNIPGYSWLFVLLAIIGMSAYILIRKHERR